VHPGVISAAVGWWFPEGEADKQFEWSKANYNMLTSARKLGREFGTPNLNSIPCRIRKKL
jgi:anaerobic selenocysteine-containing dehydrogenase